MFQHEKAFINRQIFLQFPVDERDWPAPLGLVGCEPHLPAVESVSVTNPLVEGFLF